VSAWFEIDCIDFLMWEHFNWQRYRTMYCSSYRLRWWFSKTFFICSRIALFICSAINLLLLYTTIIVKGWFTSGQLNGISAAAHS